MTITGGSADGAPLVSIMPAATLLLNQTTLTHSGPGRGVGSALRVRTTPPVTSSELAAAPAEVPAMVPDMEPAAAPDDAPAAALDAEPRVWLEGVNAGPAGGMAPPLVEALGGSGALLFSDSGEVVDDVATGNIIDAQPLEVDVAAAGFVSEASPWFQEAKRVRPSSQHGVPMLPVPPHVTTRPCGLPRLGCAALLPHSLGCSVRAVTISPRCSVLVRRRFLAAAGLARTGGRTERAGMPRGAYVIACLRVASPRSIPVHGT